MSSPDEILRQLDALIRSGVEDLVIADRLHIGRGVVHSRARELMRREVQLTPEEAAAWGICEASLLREARRRGVEAEITRALRKIERAVIGQ